MKDFLKELSNIYIVFICFILLLIIWCFLIVFILKTPDVINEKILDLSVTAVTGVFTLVNTALGAIIGLAMKTPKPTQTINADNVENANATIQAKDSPVDGEGE